MKPKPTKIYVNLDQYLEFCLPPVERHISWIEKELNIQIRILSDVSKPLPDDLKQLLLKLQGPHGKAIMAAYKAKYGEFTWPSKK